VEQIIRVAKESKVFHLAITPEGTRKANPDWKRGFYYIAKGAGIPILLAGIDFSTKTITIGKEITPSGDIEKDMREIKLYFKDFKGKHPERFTIGNID
jgi:1-acyl-sn-glycerol-3-phosphate acyltransferase